MKVLPLVGQKKSLTPAYINFHPAPLLYSSDNSAQIQQPFDWSNRHWIDIHHRSSLRTGGWKFHEMGLYELFNLDATGEVDLDIDLSDTDENTLVQ